MSIQIENIIKKYEVKKFTEKDIPDVYELCKANSTYYQYMKMKPTLENLKEVLTGVPPEKTLGDKWFVGFYKHNKLLALLDLCVGFPNENTAYIGWFMVKKELQGTGIGTEIIDGLLSFLKNETFIYAELGCIKDSKEALCFWKSNGFELTGFENDTGNYIVLDMLKKLACV